VVHLGVAWGRGKSGAYIKVKMLGDFPPVPFLPGLCLNPEITLCWLLQVSVPLNISKCRPKREVLRQSKVGGERKRGVGGGGLTVRQAEHSWSARPCRFFSWHP